MVTKGESLEWSTIGQERRNVQYKGWDTNRTVENRAFRIKYQYQHPHFERQLITNSTILFKRMTFASLKTQIGPNYQQIHSSFLIVHMKNVKNNKVM